MGAWLQWRAAAGIAVVIACAACRNSPPIESEIPEEPVTYDSREQGGSSGMSEAETRGAETAAVRTHVVQRGDTLYELARRYFNNDQSKWRKIYEANAATIPNKDLLRVGQELVIPD